MTSTYRRLPELDYEGVIFSPRRYLTTGANREREKKTPEKKERSVETEETARTPDGDRTHGELGC